MCQDCGCHEGGKDYFKDHEHHKSIELEKGILEHNDHIAHHNWHYFDDHKVEVFNLMSSPGSGKTMLLEKTLQILGSQKKISVLVGDQQTDNDAKRLEGKGGRVKQINTYSSCHLDASMIEKELGHFITGDEDILIIENIGNLVCPASFELGEKHKVALLSTAEGEDKPNKYPVLFHKASVVVITKSDLIPHLDWDLEKTKRNIKMINPNARIIVTSAKTGVGMNEWCDYLCQKDS